MEPLEEESAMSPGMMAQHKAVQNSFLEISEELVLAKLMDFEEGKEQYSDDTCQQEVDSFGPEERNFT
jgi:hypothetical protein